MGGEEPDTRVAVYKVASLARPQHRFKVDVNAQENHLTGAAVITDAFAVVIVEGGKQRCRLPLCTSIAWLHCRLLFSFMKAVAL